MEHGGDWDGWKGQNRSAICADHVMTSGRHYMPSSSFYSYSIITLFLGEDDRRYFYCRLEIMRPPLGMDMRGLFKNSCGVFV